MNIPTLYLGRLTHHQMMELGYEIVKVLSLISYEPIKEVKNDFESKVKNFDKALKYPIRSILTPQIQNANKKRTRAWSKLLSEVKNHLNDSNATIAVIAEEAYLILQTYGNPANMNRKEKSGIIRNLLEDFKTKLEPGDDELIHIKRWLEELTDWNESYIELFTARRHQQDYPKGAGLKARKECEKAYRELIDWLKVEERKINNENRNTLERIINGVNQIIIDYRTLLNQQRGQANARKNQMSDPEGEGNL